MVEKAFWRTPWEFAVHAVVGSLIFGIIAVPAIGLNALVHWLEAANGTDAWIILGLKIAEYALFGTDLVLYLVFLLVTAVPTIKKL
jgi:hypothetical protein